jgi:hypothetical protein
MEGSSFRPIVNYKYKAIYLHVTCIELYEKYLAVLELGTFCVDFGFITHVFA